MLHKHLTAATDTHATKAKLSDAVFSMQSVPMPYDEGTS
jgi:hypothetical protein